MKTLGRLLGIILLAGLFSGCSSFEQDWRHARLQPPAHTGTPAGAWEGTWLSDVNGHTGKLRCLVTRKEADEFEFRFKASYWKLFHFSYTVTMPVTCNSAGCTFKGNEDLGYLAGGIYTYEGGVEGTNLNATYSCQFDHGTFKLSRP